MVMPITREYPIELTGRVRPRRTPFGRVVLEVEELVRCRTYHLGGYRPDKYCHRWRPARSDDPLAHMYLAAPTAGYVERPLPEPAMEKPPRV